MNKQNVFIVALVAILVIAIGGYYFPQVQQILGSGTRFVNGLSTDSTSPSAGEVRTTTLTVTATTTLSNGYVVQNGVDSYKVTQAFQASTTCLLLNPFRATTTAERLNVNITGATSTAMSLFFATSSSGTATTTVGLIAGWGGLGGRQAVAASEAGYFTWKGSATNTDILGPDEYIWLWAEGKDAGTKQFSSGSCSFKFGKP